MFKVYILEKDQNYRKLLSEALSESYEILFYSNKKNIYEELNSNHFTVIILDLQIDQEDPFKLLSWITSNLYATPVVITSSIERAELVVKVIKQGAFDYIAKPYSPIKIRHVVQQAQENRYLKNEIDYLRHEQDIIYDLNATVAASPVMKETIKTLIRFSKTDSTILMTGETGTGKSFFSGAIHFNSPRREKPFVKINCANIPETLLESELFGHEKGAFTGANKLRIGRFEQAHGGTIFLDEIGETSLFIQAKLLRVLEEKSFERVGGTRTIQSDVRVIVATNRNLTEQIENGKFREDLYYRINILSTRLPPLRQRRECIEPLANWILKRTSVTLKRKIAGFSPESIEWIKAYSWPGNIRQLANVIERAMILEESSVIQKKSLLLPEIVDSSTHKEVNDYLEPIESQEKKIILSALKENIWVQKDAAKFLGISPRALNYKIKKFGITHPKWRKNQ